MKQCPKCAEQIQPDAKVCRYCGAKFSSSSSGCAAIIIGIIGLAALSQCGDSDTSKTSNATPTENALPAFTEKELTLCTDTIDNLKKLGTIRATSNPNVFEVDENVWAMTEASHKKLILIGLACAVHRKQFDALTTDEYIWINGIYSGKRIARISSYGPRLDP